MLEIFNTLEPFFEDNYRRIGVREYARLRKISPPNASSLLNQLMKEGLLQKEEERRYHLYHAHSESFAFLKLQQAFYMEKLKGLLEYIEEECVNPVIILFGSFAKGEVNSNSDIDIAVFTPTKKSLSLKPFEAKFKREVHLFMFKGQEDLKESRELLSNILNGCILSGSW